MTKHNSKLENMTSNLRPEVILDFKFDHGLFFIGIKNIGGGSAFKVSVRFNRKIMGVNGTRPISALPLFRNIEFLPPQKEIETFLDESSSYFERRQPTQITTKISYSETNGKRFNTTLNHDLEIYREIGYIRKTAE